MKLPVHKAHPIRDDPDSIRFEAVQCSPCPLPKELLQELNVQRTYIQTMLKDDLHISLQY